MTFHFSPVKTHERPAIYVLVHFLLSITLSLVGASAIASYIGADNIVLIHTIVEVICIFIGLSLFIIVWLTHSMNPPVNHIIGFGYLSVTILNLCHIYFFPGLSSDINSHYNLTAVFWLFSRFAEAFILFIGTLKLLHTYINRWVILIVTLVTVVGTSYLIIVYRTALPLMLTSGGVTPAKKTIEYLVISVFAAGLYNLRKDISNKNILTYRYIFIAILLAVPAEFTFTMFGRNDTIWFLFGHILKIVYYLYLFNGIFVSAVIYPYEKLRLEQEKAIQQEKFAILGQMGASIVHETKNYLSTIKANSQLLNLIVKDEKIKKYANSIDNATDEINRIITEFLTLSKPRSPVLDEVSLNEVVSSMRNTLETSSLVKGIEIVMDIPVEEKYIMCDKNQIKQVILNMGKNAIEAMAGVKKPVLYIGMGFDKVKSEALIVISDNGKGISEEEKEKIGTPFFTTKDYGTGLGLNVCYQIIREHGGNIRLESELGKGTTFTIGLPYGSIMETTAFQEA